MIRKLVSYLEYLWESLAKIDLVFTSFKKKNNIICFQIKPYIENENWIEYWYWFLKNFQNISESFEFCIEWNWKNIKLFAYINSKYKEYFENSFYSNFPNSEISIIEKNYIQDSWNYIDFKNWELHEEMDFKKNWIYLDPFKEILSIYNSLNENEFLKFNYRFVFFKENNIFFRIIYVLNNFLEKLIFWSDQQTPNEQIKNIITNPILYSISYYFSWFKNNQVESQNKIKKNILSLFSKFSKTWQISISPWKIEKIWNINQIINFFHIPNKDFKINNLEYVSFKKLPFPSCLPNLNNTDKNQITILWETDYKNDKVKFWIKTEDKARHIYIIWKTGSWKTTLISNMIRSDLISNKWVCVIDPHWDLIDTMLENIPSRRKNDVILFDVSDFENPIWLNILQYSSQEQKNLVVSWVVSTFKKLYWESRWPRLEYILRNVLLSIIEYPNATLLYLSRVLTDKNFREEVIRFIKDPIILKFWRNEFDKRTDKFRDEAIAPITNKVWQFFSSSINRNIFWQPISKLNFRKIMDESKILLVNLSKWKIWEDNSFMIWSFLVTKIQIDAMSRADVWYEERKDFYLYIDEFQNFTTESFERILSEARKYKLSIVVANQYISQLEENIRNAIFWNVWTIISFWVWYDDAQIISTQFKWIISPNDLLSMPKFKAYIKMLIDWVGYDPFWMNTIPLPSWIDSKAIRDSVKKQSKQRYWTNKENIENLIKIRAEKKFSPVELAIEKSKTIEFKDNEIIQKKETIPNNIWQNQQNLDNKKEILNTFSIETIQNWEIYNWVVKLKYNYWLFVTINWTEWLLHKSQIKIHEWVRWKDLYNIWDVIKVKLLEIKEVNWEKKIVWTQL